MGPASILAVFEMTEDVFMLTFFSSLHTLGCYPLDLVHRFLCVLTQADPNLILLCCE